MMAILSTMLFAASLAAASLAWADSLAQMFGGSSAHLFLSGSAIFISLGKGALNGNRAPLRWQNSLWVLIGGLAFPFLSPWLTSLISGELLSATGLIASPIIFFATWKVFALWGSHLAARVDAATPSSWYFMPIGAVAGLVTAQLFGLGVIGFTVAILSTTLLGKLPFPPPCRERLTAPNAKPHELLPLGFYTICCCFGIAYLLTVLKIFHGDSAIHAAGITAAIAFLGLIGAWAIGGSIVATKTQTAFLVIVGFIFAHSWYRLPQQIERLSNPEVFNLMMANNLILDTFNLNSQLDHHHWFYTPYTLAIIASLSLISGGACLRATAGKLHKEKKEVVSPFGPLGTIFFGIGISFFIFAISLNSITTCLPIAFFSGLLATCICVWECPNQLPRHLRKLIILSVASTPFFHNQLLAEPQTGFPFFSNHNYTVSATEFSPSGVFRVLLRNGADTAGNKLFLNGRRVVATNDKGDNLNLPFNFARSLAPLPHKKFLLVGQPNARLIPNLSWGQELDLVCDDYELAQFTTEQSSNWGRFDNLQIHSSLAQADDNYDVIFIKPVSLWASPSTFLRGTQLQIAKQKLTQNGTIAIAFELEQCSPLLLEATHNSLQQLGGITKAWLLPNQWNNPILLFSYQPNNQQAIDPKQLFPLLTSDLDLNVGDYSCLEIRMKSDLLSHWSNKLSNPVPPIDALMATVLDNEHYLENRLQRASACISFLSHNSSFNDDSILPFLNLQINGQLWDVRDTLPNSSEADRIEINAKSLDALWVASVNNPDSKLLRQLWGQLGELLIAKKEVLWCWEYFRALCSKGDVKIDDTPVQGLGWEEAELLWVIGNSALEMLEPETGLQYAQQCLQADPNFVNGKILMALCLSDLGNIEKANSVFGEAVAQLGTPGLELLLAWSEVAVQEGTPADWAQIHQLLVKHYPNHEVPPKLLESLNLRLIETK